MTKRMILNMNILHPGDTVGTGEQPDVYPLPELMARLPSLSAAALAVICAGERFPV